MMNKIKHFFATALLGGVTVILPGILTIMVFTWLFQKVNGIISPLTEALIQHWRGVEQLAAFLVIAVIVTICFFVGLAERTRLGHMLFDWIESTLMERIPGYKIIKETVGHFLGKKDSPFSSVAIVRLYNSDTWATAFITDRHENGHFTVFVPTGPNPTSGQIFHLPAEAVRPVDYPVDATMRTIISCGVGSKDLLRQVK